MSVGLLVPVLVWLRVIGWMFLYYSDIVHNLIYDHTPNVSAAEDIYQRSLKQTFFSNPTLPIPHLFIHHHMLPDLLPRVLRNIYGLINLAEALLNHGTFGGGGIDQSLIDQSIGRCPSRFSGWEWRRLAEFVGDWRIKCGSCRRVFALLLIY